MTDKIIKAIDKIDSEAEKTNSDHAKLIAQHLIKLITSDSVADLILHKNKNMSKCLAEITAKARKKAISNCAVISDDEVYSWADEYFSLNKEASTQTKGKLINFDLGDLF